MFRTVNARQEETLSSSTGSMIGAYISVVEAYHAQTALAIRPADRLRPGPVIRAALKICSKAVVPPMHLPHAN